MLPADRTRQTLYGRFYTLSGCNFVREQINVQKLITIPLLLLAIATCIRWHIYQFSALLTNCSLLNLEKRDIPQQYMYFW